jgi:hypothetical protein
VFIRGGGFSSGGAGLAYFHYTYGDANGGVGFRACSGY